MLPKAPTYLLVTLALVAAACSSAANNQAGDPSPSLPTVGQATSEPTPEPVDPEATQTPVPTPTPAPVLLAEPAPGSGLFRLSLDFGGGWQTTGVSVDGRVRAIVVATDVAQDVSVWIPEGRREVCMGEVAVGAAPTYWSGPNLPAEPRRSPAAANHGVPAAAQPTETPAPPPTPTATPAPAPAQLSNRSCTTVDGTISAPARLYPDNRVVAYYGVGITPFLGVLGEGTPEEAAQNVVDAAAAFAELDAIPTLPAFEFIATVAQANPGADGSYSAARPKEEIRTYLEQIRSVGGIMVLDFQPGQAPFIDQIREYEDLLREPDVHLALDPEWSMRPGQVPGRVIGSTDAETVNEVLDYVQGLVIRHGLPQKMVIVHQFRSDMIENRQDIVDPEGIAVVFHVDGQGPVESKYATYDVLSVNPPFFNGFKVFFDEDSRVLTPEEVLAIEPVPVFISYQ